MSTVQVKYVYSGSLRRLVLTEPVTFAKLREKFATSFPEAAEKFSDNSQNDLRLSYVDDEGDNVTICTDEELAEAVRIAQDAERVLKFTIITDSSGGSCSATTSSSTDAAASSSDSAQQAAAAAAVEEEELEQEGEPATGTATAATGFQSVDDLDAAMDAAMQEFLNDDNNGSGSSNAAAAAAAAESANAQDSADEPETPGLNFSAPEEASSLAIDELGGDVDQPSWLQVFARRLTPLLVQLQRLLRVLSLPSNEAKTVLASLALRAATSEDPCGTFARLLEEHDQAQQRAREAAFEERKHRAEDYSSAEPDSPDTLPPASAQRGGAGKSGSAQPPPPPVVSLLQSLATQYLVAGSGAAAAGATKPNPLVNVVQQLMHADVAAALPPRDVQSAVFNVVQQALSSSDVASTLSAMLGQQQ